MKALLTYFAFGCVACNLAGAFAVQNLSAKLEQVHQQRAERLERLCPSDCSLNP